MASAPSSRRYLTKSLFQKACECPRKLVYALSPDFEQKDSSGFLDTLALDGMIIGAYSRLLFPEGVEVTEHGDEAVEKTKSLLESNGSVTIFEGAFRSGANLIRADIVRKTSDGNLHLMEVKAKTWDSRRGRNLQLVGKRGNIKTNFLPYIRDVAFQKLVISEAYPNLKVITSSLVMPDKSKMNTKIPNLYGLFSVENSEIRLDDEARKLILDANEMLLTEVDVTGLVANVLKNELVYPGSRLGTTIQQATTEWGDVVQKEDDAERLATAFIPPPIGSHCSDCEFRIKQIGNEKSGFATCWAHVTGLAPEKQTNLVIDIYFASKSQTEKLLNSQKYQMSDIQPEALGLADDGTDSKKKGGGISRAERQWYQVKNDNAESVVLDRDYLLKEMKTWRYPYHFVDFETISPALPYTTNKHPYDILAFQFSHHTMNQDGQVQHSSEFLHTTPGECPNRPFLDALADSLGSCEGTVFRWGAHENTVLSALINSEQYSGETIEPLLSGGRRAMVDLVKVVSRGYYVAGSEGSSSIKKLLLPTMRHSKHLKELYSQPTYSGKNFTDMQWWQEQTEDGDLRDPYSLLGLSSESDGDAMAVAHGGDAIVAYKALQNGNLDPETRSVIRASLLRYCELDTLAMVMIMQGLQDFLEPSP